MSRLYHNFRGGGYKGFVYNDKCFAENDSFLDFVLVMQKVGWEL